LATTSRLSARSLHESAASAGKSFYRSISGAHGAVTCDSNKTTCPARLWFRVAAQVAARRRLPYRGVRPFSLGVAFS